MVPKEAPTISSQPSHKPRVVVSTGYYLPGHRGGGPIQSIANMVSSLSKEFQFYIVTPDHDFGSSEPYEGITPLRWSTVGDAKVMYLPNADFSHNYLKALQSVGRIDILYLNGFLHPKYTIHPLLQRKLGNLKAAAVIVAPRGDFSPGIFRSKLYKKLPFTILARLSGLYAGVHWHATGQNEITDTFRWFGDRISVHLAPNISKPPVLPAGIGDKSKVPGELTVSFVSRIMRKKNLRFAIERLQEVRGAVHLSICGPVEDPTYWKECEALLQAGPGSVTYKFHGSLPQMDAVKLMSESHVFLLPTLGENYGHVIAEALSCQVPVVISDQTPWQGLEAAHAGYVLPLADTTAFTTALQRFMDMESVELAVWSTAAQGFWQKTTDADSPVEATRSMLLSVLASANPSRPVGS